MSAPGMASAGGAIDYIASDLSFTISYQIARELLDVAHESDTSDDALVALIIVVGIVLNIVPRTFMMAQRMLTSHSRKEIAAKFKKKSVLTFVMRFLKIAERIMLSVVIQLIAGSARSEQPVRMQRVLTLASVSLFFIFLEQTSNVF